MGKGDTAHLEMAAHLEMDIKSGGHKKGHILGRNNETLRIKNIEDNEKNSGKKGQRWRIMNILFIFRNKKLNEKSTQEKSFGNKPSQAEE